MKVYWFVAICCLTVTALEVDENTRVNGENGWYIPQINGSLEWMDMKKVELLKAESRIIDKGNKVKFLLYTSLNPDRAKNISPSDKKIEASSFNPAWPTAIVAHGFLQNRFSVNINRDIRHSYFERQNENWNFIFVEWARALTPNYLSSVNAVPGVGKKTAKLIDFLRDKYGKVLKIHLVGHSLGAHVCGYAAKNVKTGRIEQITALDPASPGFSINKPAKRLNSTDAASVESITTDGGVYGFEKPIGSVNYYANGGNSQPGCFTNVCNHERSVTYFTDINKSKKKLVAERCTDYKSAVAKKCGGQISSVIIGGEKSKSVKIIIYYVPLTNKSPHVILTD